MDYVIATSRSAAEFVKRAFFLSTGKVAFIPNAIDIEEIDCFLRDADGDVRSELNLAESDRIVVCAAVLEERKGQASLIEAISLLKEDLRNHIHLVLAGDGSMRADYECYAVQLGLANQVHFLGFRPDVWQFIKSADVYVQPSVVDPLPRALLEAMYLEVPVVGTRIDGIPDVITQFETGLLVKVHDAREIAEAITYSLTSSDVSAMVRRAKTRIQDGHTMEGMARQITKLLKKEGR
jgi:glycosyltransferase involved in cell wall biosynthesis